MRATLSLGYHLSHPGMNSFCSPICKLSFRGVKKSMIYDCYLVKVRGPMGWRRKMYARRNVYLCGWKDRRRRRKNVKLPNFLSKRRVSGSKQRDASVNSAILLHDYERSPDLLEGMSGTVERIQRQDFPIAPRKSRS